MSTPKNQASFSPLYPFPQRILRSKVEEFLEISARGSSFLTQIYRSFSMTIKSICVYIVAMPIATSTKERTIYTKKCDLETNVLCLRANLFFFFKWA